MDSFFFRPELIGYEKAVQLALENVCRMPEESRTPMKALGRIASRSVNAIVNLPSEDSSMKDHLISHFQDVGTEKSSGADFSGRVV